MDNKGKIDGSNTFITIILGLGIGVVAIVVLAIILGAFKTSSVACPALYTLNTSSDSCYQNANNSITSSLTGAGNVTNYGLAFLSNTSGQLSTAGTILGVSLLLLIIGGIGLVGYLGYKKYGDGR